MFQTTCVTAEKARSIANRKGREARAKETLDGFINERILTFAAKGESECTIHPDYDGCESEVITTLENLGYTVSKATRFGNPNWIRVSWGE